MKREGEQKRVGWREERGEGERREGEKEMDGYARLSQSEKPGVSNLEK